MQLIELRTLFFPLPPRALNFSLPFRPPFSHALKWARKFVATFSGHTHAPKVSERQSQTEN